MFGKKRKLFFGRYYMSMSDSLKKIILCIAFFLFLALVLFFICYAINWHSYALPKF